MPALVLPGLGLPLGCRATRVLPSLVLLLLGLPLGCRASRSHGERDSGSDAVTLTTASTAPAGIAAPRPLPWLELGWDPTTGKGHVVHHLKSGNYLRTCFHCDYTGYTGGLVVGGFGASGMAYYPAVPIHGHKQINLICAQDESIWDHDEKAEYSYGWSENFGSGPDGVRLEYVGGKVLEHTPERLSLASENRAGCYVVDKIATTSAWTEYWIVATRITNRCIRPVRFDFFSGDDPWLGLYRTAAGDVGWSPSGIVRHETAFAAGELTSAGLYDLGNTAAGEREGDFTNQANFFSLDPGLPLPDFTAFANSFAHHRRQLDPLRPLDDETMTALNFGWHDISLAPGAGVTFAFAIGHALTSDRIGELPRPASIPDSEWSRWRAAIASERGTPRAGLEFAMERVELGVADTELTVSGMYLLENHDRATIAVDIRYPILVTPTQQAPTEAFVDGRPTSVLVARGGPELLLPVTLGARQIVTIQVRYKQRLLGRRAAYLVTSARSWRDPIARAELIVRHAESIKHVRLSYPASFTRRVGGIVEHTIVRQPFVPDRELEVAW